MLTYLSLVMIAVAIGALVGALGVGGMLLPPALMLLLGVDIRESTAMSLYTFIFTGIAGAFCFHRKGNLDWSLVQPVCIGAASTGCMGAWLGYHLSATLLSLVLATVLLAVGAQTLGGGREQAAFPMPQGARQRWLVLAGVGAITGLLSGLTGIGGPVLSVPLMVLCGFSVLTAIGVGQALQIVGALSGSLVHLHYIDIDLKVASFIAAFEIVGVLLGAYVIHRIEGTLVKRLVGGLCLVAGGGFILHAM